MVDPATESSHSARLLDRVARRLRVNTLIGRAHRALLVASAVYLAVLLSSRLLAIGPEVGHLAAVMALPVLAVAVALVPWPRPDRLAAARRIDEICGTADLFLTRQLLDPASGAYKPLVARSAEERAPAIEPEQVVDLRVRRRLAIPACALAAVALAILALPQLDPWGRDAVRVQTAQKQRTLEEQRALATRRAEVLRSRDVDAEVSKPVQSAVAELKKVLRMLRPNQVETNERKLVQQQHALGEKWRGTKARAARPGKSQGFGGRRSERSKQWARDLDAGRSTALTKELLDIREKLDRIRKSNGKERESLRDDVAERLRELSNFAQREAGSRELQDALARAIMQLQTTRADDMLAEALSALNATLESTELEMEALAQAMRDLSRLEQALGAVQLAQLANQKGALGEPGESGESGEDEASIEAYAELYAKMLAERGICPGCQGLGCKDCQGGAPGAPGGPGGGPGGFGQRGLGGGGVAPEDPTAQTDFTPARSRAALTAGRTLMELKVSEVADTGQAEIDHAEAIEQVRQGVGEAILKENVPPGYHDAIKGYFEKIGPEKNK